MSKKVGGRMKLVVVDEGWSNDALLMDFDGVLNNLSKNKGSTSAKEAWSTLQEEFQGSVRYMPLNFKLYDVSSS
ncbi:hypothetical protein CR513_26530, partial [Mucuna pruriens]